MPSHSLFQIDELLRQIFECVMEERFGRRSLARCARVNKTFCEPALDVLWSGHKHCMMRPLLSLLGPSVVKRQRGASKGLILSLGPNLLLPLAWPRVEYYAMKVRYMYYNVEVARVLTVVFWDLAFHLNGKPLFPRLISLRWIEGTRLTRNFVYLLSPSLQRLTIEVTHDKPVPWRALPNDYDVELMLKHIGVLAPNVSCLSLSGIEYSVTFEIAAQLKKLKMAFLDHCRASVVSVRLFARMDHLEHLGIDLLGISARHFVECTGFARLLRFHVRGTIATLTQALRCITSTSLAQIKLIPIHEASCGPAEMRALFETVARAPFAPALRKIEVKRTQLIEPILEQTTPPATVMDVLEPLLALSLEFISVDVCTEALTIAGDDFRTMALAWPHLQWFSLLYDRTASAGVSVAVVAEFSRSCPRLHGLCLPLLAARHWRVPLEPLALSSHPLQVFHMYGMDVDVSNADARKMAPYILHLFPQLKATWKPLPGAGGIYLTS